MLKNNTQTDPQNSPQDWQPNASLESIKARAKLLADIRSFFRERGVLEVETPLMCQTAATDPYLNAIQVANTNTNTNTKNISNTDYFLQTSPEFAMKRLLAAGIGSIYQLCKAFRNDESGRIHNPEFTILEWYRINFDHHQLMDEMDALLTRILETKKAERISYHDLFWKHFAFNPHTVSLKNLQIEAEKQSINIPTIQADSLSKDDWLDLLLTHCLEPHLGIERPLFIYDYPESQAALAKIRKENSAVAESVAERFEVYVGGVELANGYHELVDANVQLARFEKDCQTRKELGLSAMPIDFRLVNALEAGLPNCAGVALGIDRLLMLKRKAKSLNEVLTFNVARA